MLLCDAIENPTFLPAYRLISAITTANPAVVTTTFNHDYTDDQIIRFQVPNIYGMTEIDGKEARVTVTGETTFSVDIDATLFTPFSVPAMPPPHSNRCALIIPVGEVGGTLAGATQNVLT